MSVYVDMSATEDAVRAAVAVLPRPVGVLDVDVDCSAVSDTFGCKIVVELTGTFDEQGEGPIIARDYAKQLATAIGVPAFALYDLLRTPGEV